MNDRQPVTHMRSTNSKQQPSNQFQMDIIKFAMPFHSEIHYDREEKLQVVFHADFKFLMPGQASCLHLRT